MEEKIYYIFKSLDETRQTLMNIFEKMAERGTKTEEIHEKSKELVNSSKVFEKIDNSKEIDLFLLGKYCKG